MTKRPGTRPSQVSPQRVLGRPAGTYTLSTGRTADVPKAADPAKVWRPPPQSQLMPPSPLSLPTQAQCNDMLSKVLASPRVAKRQNLFRSLSPPLQRQEVGYPFADLPRGGLLGGQIQSREQIGGSSSSCTTAGGLQADGMGPSSVVGTTGRGAAGASSSSATIGVSPTAPLRTMGTSGSLGARAPSGPVLTMAASPLQPPTFIGVGAGPSMPFGGVAAAHLLPAPFGSRASLGAPSSLVGRTRNRGGAEVPAARTITGSSSATTMLMPSPPPPPPGGRLSASSQGAFGAVGTGSVALLGGSAVVFPAPASARLPATVSEVPSDINGHGPAQTSQHAATEHELQEQRRQIHNLTEPGTTSSAASSSASAAIFGMQQHHLYVQPISSPQLHALDHLYPPLQPGRDPALTRRINNLTNKTSAEVEVDVQKLLQTAPVTAAAPATRKWQNMFVEKVTNMKSNTEREAESSKQLLKAKAGGLVASLSANALMPMLAETMSMAHLPQNSSSGAAASPGWSPERRMSGPEVVARPRGTGTTGRATVPVPGEHPNLFGSLYDESREVASSSSKTALRKGTKTQLNYNIQVEQTAGSSVSSTGGARSVVPAGNPFSPQEIGQFTSQLHPPTELRVEMPQVSDLTTTAVHRSSMPQLPPRPRGSPPTAGAVAMAIASSGAARPERQHQNHCYHRASTPKQQHPLRGAAANTVDHVGRAETAFAAIRGTRSPLPRTTLEDLVSASPVGLGGDASARSASSSSGHQPRARRPDVNVFNAASNDAGAAGPGQQEAGGRIPGAAPRSSSYSSTTRRSYVASNKNPYLDPLIASSPTNPATGRPVDRAAAQLHGSRQKKSFHAKDKAGLFVDLLGSPEKIAHHISVAAGSGMLKERAGESPEKRFEHALHAARSTLRSSSRLRARSPREVLNAAQGYERKMNFLAQEDLARQQQLQQASAGAAAETGGGRGTAAANHGGDAAASTEWQELEQELLGLVAGATTALTQSWNYEDHDERHSPPNNTRNVGGSSSSSARADAELGPGLHQRDDFYIYGRRPEANEVDHDDHDQVELQPQQWSSQSEQEPQDDPPVRKTESKGMRRMKLLQTLAPHVALAQKEAAMLREAAKMEGCNLGVVGSRGSSLGAGRGRGGGREAILTQQAGLLGQQALSQTFAIAASQQQQGHSGPELMPSSTSGSEIDADPIPASSSSASANNIREPVQQSQPQSTHTHSTASDQHHRVVLPDEEISRPTTNENRRKMFDARNRPRRPSQLHISAVDDYLLDGATNSVSIAGDNHSTNFSVRGVQEGTPGTFVPAKNVNFSLLNGAGGATGGLLSSGSGTRNSSAFVSTAQSGAAAMQMMTAAASMQASASLTGAGGGTGVNAATSPVFPATHQAAGIALQPQDALRMPKIVSTGTRMISSSSPPAEGAASGTNAAGNSQPLYFYQHVNDSSAAWSSKNSKEGSSFSSVAADENKDGSVFTSAAARQLHVSHHQHLSEQALKMEQATTKKYINPYFLQPVETITVSPQEIRINELEQRETELKVEGENFYNEVLHLEAEVDRLKKQKMAEEQEKREMGAEISRLRQRLNQKAGGAASAAPSKMLNGKDWGQRAASREKQEHIGSPSLRAKLLSTDELLAFVKRDRERSQSGSKSVKGGKQGNSAASSSSKGSSSLDLTKSRGDVKMQSASSSGVEEALATEPPGVNLPRTSHDASYRFPGASSSSCSSAAGAAEPATSSYFSTAADQPASASSSAVVGGGLVVSTSSSSSSSSSALVDTVDQHLQHDHMGAGPAGAAGSTPQGSIPLDTYLEECEKWREQFELATHQHDEDLKSVAEKYDRELNRQRQGFEEEIAGLKMRVQLQQAELERTREKNAASKGNDVEEHEALRLELVKSSAELAKEREEKRRISFAWTTQSAAMREALAEKSLEADELKKKFGTLLEKHVLRAIEPLFRSSSSSSGSGPGGEVLGGPLLGGRAEDEADVEARPDSSEFSSLHLLKFESLEAKAVMRKLTALPNFVKEHIAAKNHPAPPEPDELATGELTFAQRRMRFETPTPSPEKRKDVGAGSTAAGGAAGITTKDHDISDTMTRVAKKDEQEQEIEINDADADDSCSVATGRRGGYHTADDGASLSAGRDDFRLNASSCSSTLEEGGERSPKDVDDASLTTTSQKGDQSSSSVQHSASTAEH